MKRSTLRPVSLTRAAILSKYRELKDLLAPWLRNCARCETACNPDLHHPYKRGKGRFSWKTFCVIPLCRCCHDWVHANENQAREDGWLIKPVHKDRYEPV